MSNTITNKRVFISYAWETESFKEEIWELAGWLEKMSENRIEVITDHLYSVIPPPNGWYRWMQQEINRAAIVLIACTPKYKIFFEGNGEALPGGYGVTHEGCIIHSDFFAAKGNNTKFYPIIPDYGSIKDIPTILTGYHNNLTFSSRNSNILNLILGENPRHKGRENAASNTEETKEILNTIQLELEVTEQLTNTFTSTKAGMSYDIQILIRAYLSLSEIDRTSIILALTKRNISDLPSSPFEKDKMFLNEIHELSLLKSLWEEVNKYKQFENQNNPF